ncbi:glycosyl transferase family 1 [Sandarakinorhabdus cyanobacteriorum]|uniref:Glycosyl transferase family 1 n=1 Tax=Sandarakinorhabdus cyanobacteriorum TaxID=1981098 RepID=A0A255Y672_9SPHN|nr:ABC-F family ATP-binding cassette domain-containing protein [Sandarakinorhabdus cyanobacteriorum]OYQ24661.1 glycosyl transferase family 1 [Sandarakinorhabdus cyanobacteriorum]
MLSVNDLIIRMGGRAIIDGASATLPARGCVGLVGRNGAGKSTVMKAMAGVIEPDGGRIDKPRAARLGWLKQDAPSGSASAFDMVMAADTERAALLAEEEAGAPPERLADLHERLIAIDAYTAPARAARILKGLGFDEAMQARPLDSFSGGWRMRVALASLLFTGPDILLLDEPSNHLDLESALWLEDFLLSYPGLIVLISHERDLLNRVAGYILHLEAGKMQLYVGNYDSFERQRAERLAQLEAARAAQAAQRAKLQDYIARNSARASTAKQAQSRAKALARMQPVAEAATDPTLTFDFPSPQPLRPPLVTLDQAEVGYDGKPVLGGLDLRLDPDDRLALVGRNGNGKTTLARLMIGQLPAMAGARNATGKLKVGYFTQYQVEELDRDATPLQHMSRAMKGAAPAAVRAQLGRFGFSGPTAEQKIGTMSGGERARLALALVTRDAPHLIVLDEPTNHLDIDARQALVQALAGYEGAVVVVSHDRHLIEATADRLVLVDSGRATPFDGSIDDYEALVLGGSSGGNAAPAPAAKAPRIDPKEARRQAAARREAAQPLRKAMLAAETKLNRLIADRESVEEQMTQAPADITALMLRKGALDAEISAAEEQWLAASEAYEAAIAA